MPKLITSKINQLRLSSFFVELYFIDIIKYITFYGLPLVRKIETGLWEVRVQLDNRIARILFTAHEGIMVLLHGFIKKSQKTPVNDLKVAKQRMVALGGRHE